MDDAPVVFFKLQLILFFEGLRSERQLMQVVADRLSLRWYLGYDLTEPLPDHSSLTRIRERYGLAVFRRFFEAIVEQCIHAGLVWGEERSIDSTKVAANAATDSLRKARRARTTRRAAMLMMLMATNSCGCQSNSPRRRRLIWPTAPHNVTIGSSEPVAPIGAPRAALTGGRRISASARRISMPPQCRWPTDVAVWATKTIPSSMAARLGSSSSPS
jgi:hypothetical protein